MSKSEYHVETLAIFRKVNEATRKKPSTETVVLLFVANILIDILKTLEGGE